MEFAAIRWQLEALKSFRRPWFLTGGWAIDLFLGHKTRGHKDVDIAVFREDQFELRRHLPDWDWEMMVDGTPFCWKSDEWLELSIDEVRAKGGPYHLKFLFNERQGDLWEYRRDRTCGRPISHFRVLGESGLPAFPPEVVLLYKSENPSATDLSDFRKVWPLLTFETRQWLADAMVRGRPQTWNMVEIVDYDEQWPADFSQVASEVSGVLGELAIAIEHVGSTSVPGLAAKPIIDVDVLIRDNARFCRYP